jgi:hypothetical protein
MVDGAVLFYDRELPIRCITFLPVVAARAGVRSMKPLTIRARTPKHFSRLVTCTWVAVAGIPPYVALALVLTRARPGVFHALLIAASAYPTRAVVMGASVKIPLEARTVLQYPSRNRVTAATTATATTTIKGISVIIQRITKTRKIVPGTVIEIKEVSARYPIPGIPQPH